MRAIAKSWSSAARQIGSRSGWSTGTALGSSGCTATAHFEVPHFLISSTAKATSRVEAMIGPLSRSG
jgi:hypothetical protein